MIRLCFMCYVGLYMTAGLFLVLRFQKAELISVFYLLYAPTYAGTEKDEKTKQPANRIEHCMSVLNHCQYLSLVYLSISAM